RRAGAGEVRAVDFEADRPHHRRADRVERRGDESVTDSLLSVLSAAHLRGVSTSSLPAGSPGPIGASSAYQPVPPLPVTRGMCTTRLVVRTTVAPEAITTDCAERFCKTYAAHCSGVSPAPSVPGASVMGTSALPPRTE